jgi:hypothetical protein
MTRERVLRIAALLIAALALIDPTLTFASRQRPVIALSIVGSPSLARPIAGAETGLDRARRVRAQLAGTLAETFDVREGPAPEAVAQVLIGDGSFPSDTALVEGVGAGATTSASVDAERGANGSGTGLNGSGGDASGNAGAGLNAGSNTDASVPLAAVTIDSTPAPNVRVLRVDTPRRAPLTAQMSVTAIVEARGMAGATSTITLRVDDLEMARITHAWTQPVETATVVLDAIPFRSGLARVTVAAEPLAAEATAADNVAETATDITNEKIAVLFVEARPSWMTRFARQALDGDDRFAIKTLSRVSRGLTAVTPDTPQALTQASLEPFAAVIVGAPDALTRPDVEALREFARVRGGLVIFAPDQQPSGAYVDLLPARAFDEKIQEEPRPVYLRLDDDLRVDDAASGAAHTTPPSAQAGSDHRNKTAISTFAASELALPRELLPGAQVLGRIGDPRTGAPLIVSSPAGDGEIVFVGALDAWRFRDVGAGAGGTSSANGGNADNAGSAAKAGAAQAPGAGGAARAASASAGAAAGAARATSAGAGASAAEGFDACWRQLVATLGSRAPAPIEVALDAPLATPGSPVTVHVRLRKTAVGADGAMPPLVARVTSLTESPGRAGSITTSNGGNGTSSGRSGADTRAGAHSDGRAAGNRGEDGDATTFRLWPGDQLGQLTGTLNAPSRTGVYAVSVGLDRGALMGRATLRVAPDAAPAAAVAWEDGLRTFVEARGGVVTSAADTPRLIEYLHQHVRASTITRARHPFRSAWWMAPFAACLGGEWWLRRRRGQR